MKFLNDVHENRFNELIIKDKTTNGDIERESLFYILTGSDDLYNQINDIYDFEERSIVIPHRASTSGGTERLIQLAFHLYNSYEMDYSLNSLLGVLDDNNFKLALLGILHRH